MEKKNYTLEGRDFFLIVESFPLSLWGHALKIFNLKNGLMNKATLGWL
jgi:hypothetical protein